MAMLGTAVAGLSHLDTLLPAVRALGQRHASYGVSGSRTRHAQGRVNSPTPRCRENPCR